MLLGFPSGMVMLSEISRLIAGEILPVNYLLVGW